MGNQTGRVAQTNVTDEIISQVSFFILSKKKRRDEMVRTSSLQLSAAFGGAVGITLIITIAICMKVRPGVDFLRFRLQRM